MDERYTEVWETGNLEQVNNALESFWDLLNTYRKHYEVVDGEWEDRIVYVLGKRA